MTRSAICPCRTPATIPSQMPNTTTIANDTLASMAERPTAPHNTCATGRSITRDWPRSPRRRPPAQRRYCTRAGSFRPSFSCSMAISAGWAKSPRMVWATLPGSTCVIQKMRTDITHTVTAM